MTAEDEASDQLLLAVEQARLDGRFTEALAGLDSLPPEMRDQFQVLAREADLCRQLGEHDRELAIYDRLIEQWPQVPSLWVTKAHTLKTVGRSDESIAAARHAIALQPTYGKAWWVLADLKSYAFSDEERGAMEAALGTSGDRADLFHLHFALGKAFEDRKDWAEAFAHYAAGNDLRAAAIPADATKVSVRVDKWVERLSASFFADRAGYGYASEAPIFIVGLPRSGTTLIEQILGSHSSIEATGELNLIAGLQTEIARDLAVPGEKMMQKLGSLDAEQLAALGRTYVERAGAFRKTDKPRFIDKMPANWLHVGFIQLILPNAVIIDARRHPMASGFSNFRQNYGRGAAWSYSLDSIGRYYRDYLRLMRHFDQVLPGRIHRVINERLIDDFEPEVRRLLDHVGVDFEPACLEFHRSTRPVRSASAEQVRRPVNRDGIDQWRAFEPWLGPLKDALGDALEDWQG